MKRLPVLLALLLFGSSGCAAFSEDDGASATDAAGGGALRVATAFYPLQYVTERVAGDLATVENLTTPGKEPHDLEPTVRETGEIAQADLVVFERGFQPALDDAVDQNATGATIDAAEVVSLRESEVTEEGHEGETAEEHAEHSEEAHSEDEAHAEEEHDHGGLDPHFWQDPILLSEVADEVATQLADLDPDNASTYEDNAAALRTDLETLDASYAAGLGSCERDTVVVSHDAFGYLTKYGLAFEPIAGLSPEAEPTPADLGRLQGVIADAGITTVFGERLASPALTETLASDVGVQTAVLDPIEGLTDETSGEDYLSLMQQNLDALKEANGCQ